MGWGGGVSGSESMILYQQKVLPHPPVPFLSALSLVFPGDSWEARASGV